MYRAFREAAKPLGQKIVERGAATLPHRGGLSARVAQSKVTQSNATTGKNPKVMLRVKTREGYDLKAMDRGQLRHPVYGRPVWVRQNVPAGEFTKPFEQGSEDVRRQVLAALERVADQIGRSTSGGRI